MANWKEPKNDYKKEDQVVPEIFNTLAENERYLQEKKITTEQVQDAVVTSTQATSRTEIGGSETVKGFFGKVRKWFADLKALAFKGTVATADIDNSAVTSAKIASSAVTTTKINDKAVTDAKINSVSASKVTGLHKVATSGDYNDLINKPSTGGGGFNFKRYDFYLGETPSDIDAGIYLCFVVFTNRASISNVANLGLITCSPDCDNGSYSGISSIYDSGEMFKIQLEMMWNNGKASMRLISSNSEGECPTYYGYDGDGGFRVSLIKLSDLGTIGLYDEDSGGGGGTWQSVSNSLYQLSANYGDKSTGVQVMGLKKGEPVKFKAGAILMKEDYSNECYFFNAPGGNAVYGFTYDGVSYNSLGDKTGWYQHQYEYEYPQAAELELSSESPYVGKVGLIDYSTPNVVKIKVSCPRDNFLQIEWSDTAGFYIESMMIVDVQAKR